MDDLDMDMDVDDVGNMLSIQDIEESLLEFIDSEQDKPGVTTYPQGKMYGIDIQPSGLLETPKLLKVKST